MIKINLLENSKGKNKRGGSSGPSMPTMEMGDMGSPKLKILAVLVKPGSKVEEDDELVVIEALKMENTVYATAAGTVKEIKVKKGDSVEDEDVLIVLE